MTLGERLKQRRLAHELSQEQVAEHLGISRQAVAKWEGNQTSPLSLIHILLAGGGFIGLEMAENLTELGVQVTIVQRPRQVLAPLDGDMAQLVHGLLCAHGVRLKLGSTVAGFEADGDQVRTLLEGCLLYTSMSALRVTRISDLDFTW